MNLFESPPIRQIDLFHAKLKLFEQAGITGPQARKAALKEAGKAFKRNGKRKRNVQLVWHFQIDLKGQQYLKGV